MGHDHSKLSTLVAFVGKWPSTSMYLNLSVMLMSNYFASTIWNWVCNNYVNFDVCEILVNYLRPWCNMCLIYVESCMILVECWLIWNMLWFHQTIGFIWAKLWQFDHFGDCYRTCALINWMVLLQGLSLAKSYPVDLKIRTLAMR
jgi:hypothetical protein